MSSFKYKSEVVKSKCSAKVVAFSISPSGEELVTYELEYPRIILAELNTHRVFSRNSMSSRAIPVNTMLKQIRQEPASPVEFGKNKAGMSSDGEYSAEIQGKTPEEFWNIAGFVSAMFSQAFADAGYHKQVANRLIEPFQRMKTVLSTTESENFFKLRLADDSDPTIKQLAECMLEAYNKADPEHLTKFNKWHLPYIKKVVSEDSVNYYSSDDVELSEEQAKEISTSCNAQVSYRTIDNSYTKALNVFDKLGLNTDHAHLSPTEHVACVMEYAGVEVAEASLGYSIPCGYVEDFWEYGITHMDRSGNFWSGNFKGFIQYRQLL